MARVPLLGGFYQAKSLIAGAQRCLNLYPEINTEGEDSPTTTYLTPGLTILYTPAIPAQWRCLYTASTGDLYGVLGSNVYYIDSGWNLTLLGSIVTTTGQCSMSDNSLVILLVDGSTGGWVIDLTTRKFSAIQSGGGAFYGANRVDYVDTFFILNRPLTNQFYISLSEVSYAMAIGGSIATGAISAAGSGYPNGTYAAVNLTGGSGSGADADITVSGNAVTAVTIDTAGQSYLPGDVLSADLGGSVNSGTIAGGSGYTNGTFTSQSLTGGSGSGAVATITVSGGIVTAVSITTAGIQYQIGDVLTAALAGGTGFTYTVNSTTGGSGFTYTVATVNGSAFDPLDIAAKVGGQDLLRTLICMHDEIWLLGTNKTSEVWYDSGAADFAFAKIPGVFVEHGCAAIYCVAKNDLAIFWVGLDPQGSAIAFKGAGYAAQRISTNAIEAEWTTYGDTSDAIGFTYQQEGHSFWVITFPGADKTWVYDVETQLWHERAWIDSNGDEHRIRANCAAFAYGTNVVGDWQNGNLYALDQDNQTDFGGPITRRRGFPHEMADGKRASFTQFLADVACGGQLGGQSSAPPQISLRWSDTRGASWGNPVMQSLGATGQYLTQPQWRRLGMARDRVFELFWDCPQITALNGAFVEAEAAET